MTNIISLFYSKHLCKIFLLVATISLFSSGTFAQIPLITTEQSGITFDVDTIYGKNACVVQKKGGKYMGNITIPNYVTIKNKQYPVTVLSQEAFSFCTELRSVIMPNSIKYIGNNCFYGSGIEQIDIPSSVKQLRAGCFAYCESLKTVKLPNSISILSGSTFTGCISLEEIDIPNTITEIGQSCFHDCTSLSSIKIPNSVTILGLQCFYGCSGLTSVKIPKSVRQYNASFYYCINLKEILVDDENPKFTSVDGVLFNKDMTKIITYPIGKDADTYTIPKGINYVDWACFDNCNKLKNISFTTEIKSISQLAFNSCSSLTNVVLPDSVEHIGWWAFANCDNLSSITLPDSLKDIVAGSFENCKNLKKVICHAIKVPQIKSWNGDHNPFKKCPEDRILYVPKASLEDYKNADYWKDFAQILPIETTGINDVIDTSLVFSSNEKGKVSITGLHIGEIIQCYNASGLLIQTFKAASNEIAITTAEPIIIIKARKQTYKIFVKQ